MIPRGVTRATWPSRSYGWFSVDKAATLNSDDVESFSEAFAAFSVVNIIGASVGGATSTSFPVVAVTSSFGAPGTTIAAATSISTVTAVATSDVGASGSANAVAQSLSTVSAAASLTDLIVGADANSYSFGITDLETEEFADSFSQAGYTLDFEQEFIRLVSAISVSTPSGVSASMLATTHFADADADSVSTESVVAELEDLGVGGDAESYSFGITDLETEEPADSFSQAGYEIAVNEEFVSVATADSVSDGSAEAEITFIEMESSGSADSVSTAETDISVTFTPSEILATVTISRPRDVALVGGKLYVTENNDPGNVHVLDEADPTRLIKKIPLKGPFKIGAVGNRLYVTCNDGVSVIDATTDTVVNNITGFTSLRFAVPYGNKVYVGEYGAGVKIIDVNTDSVIKTIPTQGGTSAAIEAALAGGSELFVLSGAGSGTVIDTTTDTVLRNFNSPVHNYYGSASICAIGTKVLVGGFEPYIDVINAAMPQVPIIQTLPISGQGFNMTGDGATAYVAVYDKDEVVGVWQKPGTTGDLEPRNTFKGMSGPVAVRIYGRKLYICNNTNGTVVVANIPEGGEVTDLAVLLSARALATSTSTSSATSSSGGSTSSSSASALAYSTSTATVSVSSGSGSNSSVSVTAASRSAVSVEVALGLTTSATADSRSSAAATGRLDLLTISNSMTVNIPAEATSVDVVALGGGGGGAQAAGPLAGGNGGGAGSFDSRRFTRGTNLTGSTVTVVVGSGGSGGSGGTLIADLGADGSPSTARVDAVTLTGSGGRRGGVGLSHIGASPGNLQFNGYTYVGGSNSNVGSTPGDPPGAGGNGVWPPAGLGANGVGGDGAKGAVWVRFIYPTTVQLKISDGAIVMPPDDSGDWDRTEEGFVQPFAESD